MLATLADEKQATEALRSAKLLRRSTAAHIRDNVYVNADLTQQQRTALFNAHTEIRRRRAAGEMDLVIRDGHVVKKSASRAALTASGTTAPAAPLAAGVTA